MSGLNIRNDRSGKLLTSKKPLSTSPLSSPDVRSAIKPMMEARHNQILEETVEGKSD